MSAPAKDTWHFYPWEESTPDFAARPKNPFTPFELSEVEGSISERFEQIVRQYPDRTAIVDGDQSLTYRALNEAANRAAWAILELESVSDGEAAPTVALFFDQGRTSIVALMAAIKAGKAYVPLDPTHPRARIEYMLEDSRANLILTDRAHLDRARELAALVGQPCCVLDLDALDPDLPVENPVLDILPTDYAYILYTSGTTGQPKGVLGSHRQVLHFTALDVNQYHIMAQDRISMVASLSFSASLLKIFPALLTGAALYPFDLKGRGIASLADWLAETEITCFTCVPAVFRSLCGTLGNGQAFPQMRVIRLGGDLVVKQDVMLYRQHFGPSCRFYLGYGATEAKTISSLWLNHDSHLPDTALPVGYAPQETEVLVLDPDGRPVEAGEVGEIAVKSRYLSPGYWRQPELTAAKFLPAEEVWSADTSLSADQTLSADGPASGSEERATRIYRTGDLGRRAEDGCLWHLGRVDLQVKIRGYRVEIGEIETALADLEEIREAVVVVRDAVPQLVAYIVPTVQPGPSVSKMRRVLSAALPEYMIPALFVTLDEMPLTVNNKVDRRALPEPEMTRPELSATYVGARDEIERELVEIWENVLGIEPIGVQDDFFELGGDSLSTVRLLSDIQSCYDQELSWQTFFSMPTIEHVADALHGEQPAARRVRPGRGKEKLWRGLKNRLLQAIALYLPGAKSNRVHLHRMRGVQVGKDVFIGLGVILESGYPQLISIGNHVTISVRSVVIAHARGSARGTSDRRRPSVRVDDHVFIGPMVTILPNVTIGEGAVVAAGSVVSRSVPPHTMVQGNPAQVVARCGVPFRGHPYEEFMRHLEPVRGRTDERVML